MECQDKAKGDPYLYSLGKGVGENALKLALKSMKEKRGAIKCVGKKLRGQFRLHK